jgi:hypothetical protein
MNLGIFLPILCVLIYHFHASEMAPILQQDKVDQQGQQGKTNAVNGTKGEQNLVNLLFYKWPNIFNQQD